MEYILNKLITIPMVLIALTVHEFAHGKVSEKLGDPTPKMSGRLSLNPLAHLDPIGTLLMIFTGFGWANPVPIDPRYYKNPKKGMAVTALAGPVANILLAALAMLVYGVLYIVYAKLGILATVMGTVTQLIIMFVQLNLCLAVFNFIPIPPLDGSRILGVFLSDNTYFKLQQYERYSFVLIILFSALGLFDRIIGTGVNFLFTHMLYGLGKLVGLVI